MNAHSAPNSPIAAGLRALPGGPSAFAATQAAWRFYANPSVTLKKLFAPILGRVGASTASLPEGAYLPVVHDWCWLQYAGHSSKGDRIAPPSQKACGYELGTALAVSPVDGSPLGPLSLDLCSREAVHTSRLARPRPRPPEQAGERPDPSGHALSLQAQVEHAEEVAQALQRPLKLVHVVDREADQVGLYRALAGEGRAILVRAREGQRVEHCGRSCLLGQVAGRLSFRLSLRLCRAVEYQGRPARQYVAETRVTLTRPASNGSHHKLRDKSHHESGRRRRAPLPGPPVPMRLVVSEVRDEAGKPLAVWLLFTNLPAEGPEAVPAEQVALWYYWRWRVETFFKLLKSAGWNLEEWQQETAAAVAKRLAIVCMAAVLVWQVAHSHDPPVEEFARELVRLSGRQTKRSRPVTAPAILAGLWTLLSTLELLERYDQEQLRHLANQAREFYFASGP